MENRLFYVRGYKKDPQKVFDALYAKYPDMSNWSMVRFDDPDMIIFIDGYGSCDTCAATSWMGMTIRKYGEEIKI